MKITIKRIYGNVDFTIGIASIEGRQFKCYTLERRSADYSKAANKRNNHALPCGDYPFRFLPRALSPMTPVSAHVKGFGKITIVKVKYYDYLGTGDIALTDQYPIKGEIKINEKLYDTFIDICYDECSKAAWNGFAFNKFVIEEAEEFLFDENYRSLGNLNDINYISDETFE